MKLIVCKGCGQQMQATRQDGTPVCITCIGISPDSGIPIEVEMPDVFKCSSCGKERRTEDILKSYVSIPFASSNGTYYCGCRGWE